MPEVEKPNKVAGALKQGPKSTRKSAVGTNDWLDDIVGTLTSITNAYNAKFTERPELLPVFLEQQKMLVDLTIQLVTLRYDVEAGQPPAQPPNGPIDKGSGGADDGPMEARIAALEKDMSVVKTDVAVIRSNYATKEDLHKELHLTTWKIIGAIALLTAAVYFLARNGADVHSASPQTAQTQASPVAPLPAERAKADQIPR